jgi:Uma2 family endonuclease
MSNPAVKTRLTTEQYFELEEKALDRHEFHDGEMLAMAGASFEHSVLTTRIILSLGNQLSGKPCTPLSTDLRVRVGYSRRYVYPDLLVLCGPPQFDPLDPQPGTLLNPTVIVEVLSPTSEAYDRGEKFSLYRAVESMKDYVLVSQDRPRVEVFSRRESGDWRIECVEGLEAAIALPSIDATLKLADIYQGITFPPPKPPTPTDR